MLKRKLKKIYILVSGVMLVLLIILTFSLLRLYQDKEVLLVNVLRFKLENILERFASSVILFEKKYDNIVSTYGNKVVIKKNNKTYKFEYNNTIEAKKAYTSALYDLRRPELWSLKDMDTLFRQNVSDLRYHSIFILQDSTGKTLDMLKNGLETIPNNKQTHMIPLGLLEKHQLKICFTLPVYIFLEDEWAMVMFLLASFIILGISLGGLSIWLKKEREIRQNEELNLQTVNHDMKSPINLIGLNLNLLEQAGTSTLIPDQQTNLRIAKEQIGQLDTLVKQISSQYVNSRGLVLKLKKFNLSELIENIVANVRMEVDPQKKVSFRTFYYPNREFFITADRFQLKRALSNIVRNAIKYSEEEVSIIISCIHQKNRTIISVKDNGIGIAASDRPYIFKLGYRSPEIERRTEGTGLGLSFADMVVRAHGGQIVYREGMKNGSKFVIFLTNRKKWRRFNYYMWTMKLLG